MKREVKEGKKGGDEVKVRERGRGGQGRGRGKGREGKGSHERSKEVCFQKEAQ